MTDSSNTAIAERITAACASKQAVRITSGNSKVFYGNAVEGEPLDISACTGIVSYQPSELVITARSATPLSEIEAVLAEHQQMLPFEPPAHNEHSTLGGAIACGLSGPRRAFTGPARDYVLGTTIINGKGEQLKFGGQVMKNVAGYDASRLMCGAQGTLGVMLEISIKVLPMPEQELTLRLESSAQQAVSDVLAWTSKGVPVTASCHIDGDHYVRLGNTRNSVESAVAKLGGEQVDDSLWQQLRHQRHDIFQQPDLWRISVPRFAPIDSNITPMLEWGGALRWAVSTSPLFDYAASLGGHATRYALHGNNTGELFQPLSTGVLALHQRLKQAFDPAGILNPGRLYAEL